MVLSARRALATGLLAGSAALWNCVWVDEDDAVTRAPKDYRPAAVRPVTLSGVTGVALATSREIAAFLGTEDFRLAIVDGQQVSGVFNLCVLEPSGGNGPLRVHLYPVGRETWLGSGQADGISGCDLSPDGKSLLYSLQGPNPYPAIHWIQGVSPGNEWRIPLFSSSNGSLGYLAVSPFWHLEGAKTRVVFTGLRQRTPQDLPWISDRGGVFDDFTPSPTQQVELEDERTVSGIQTSEPGLDDSRAVVQAITRDGEWTLLDSRGGRYVVPASRLGDSALLESRRSLMPMQVARASDLNPFDPSKTTHTDYYATWRFQPAVEEGIDQPVPRTLDGAPADTSGAGIRDEIWICDRNRRIILTHDLGGAENLGANWIRWTNHPNFLLVNTVNALYIVKLAESAEALLGNAEERTMRAVGELRVASLKPTAGTLDIGWSDLWVAE